MKSIGFRCLFVCSLIFSMLASLEAVEPKLAQGYFHSLYLAADGTLWAVGRNNFGQLGIAEDDITNRTEWTKVDTSGMNGVVTDITCGYYFSMALTSTGDCYVWGDNTYGQCGADPDLVGNERFEVPRWVASDNIQISAGDYHCGVLKVWGSVYLWGRNNYGQIALANSTAFTFTPSYKYSPCSQVSLGRYHSLVLRADGDVYGCGYNYNGELGRGFTSGSPYYEQSFGLVTGLPPIRKIAAGAYHNMAIADNGYVWAWGSNTDGQLVRPAGPDEPTPFQISSSGGHWAALDIACGYNHTMVLRVTGQVYMAGANNYGQIGNNVDDNADVEVSTLVLSSAKAIPTSMYHGAGVINGDGSLLTWGYNSYRAIGNTSLLTEVLTPTSVEAKWPVEDLVDLKAGQYHSIGLKADGTVWTWGDNNDGNLGNGLSPTDSNEAVQAYSGSSVTDCFIIGSGSYAAHSMVGKVDGSLYGFGNNVYGELDNATLNDHISPTAIGNHYPLSIGCGDTHTSYVNWTGYIYTTGRNNNAQLGVNYPTDRTSFGSVAVPGSTTAKQVSAGLGHTLALMCDGRVLAWGANSNNQCGVSGNPVLTPQFVQRDTNGDGTPDGDLTNIIMVAAGAWHSFALESNGKIWAWGTNDAGRTGLGTSSGKTQYATRITGGATYYRSVAGGVYHGAAIDNTGTVYTWGYGANGRLGNGLTAGNVLEPEPRINAAYDGLVTHVDCSNHTIILCADGDVFGTGQNSNGQLGTASFSDTSVFTAAKSNWYPQVNISATSSNAYESGTQATFQVSRSLTVPGTIEHSGIIDVNFDPNQGVAQTGVDLQNLSTTIRIPASSSAANFSVAAINDQIDEDNESISIDVIAGDRYQIGSTPTANGNVIDNDTANVILALVSAPTSTESGGYATYTMRLATEPTSNVSVTMQTSDTTEGTIWSGLTQKTLVFNSGNWSTDQYFYMVGENDDVVDGDIVYYLEHVSTTGDPKYAGLGLLADQAITNKDDDSAGFKVIPGTVETDENGTTDTFTITLTSEPVDDVTIPISSTNINEAEVSPTSFTFNAGNWSTGVEVTVTGADDDIDDGSVPYAIKLNPDNSTSDPNYQFLNPPDVTGTNHDNDTAGITIGPLDQDTQEDGTQGTFTVVLDTQPLSDVSIGLSSSDTGEITVSSGSLTFTSANWNTPQVVTLTGVDDFIADGDQTVTIFTDPATGDAAYVGINPNDVLADNLDDDVVGLTFNKTQLYVTEGGATDSYTINLNSEPIGGNVTINISPQTGVETDKSQLIFTAGNWATPQTVVVSATDDVVDETSPEIGVQINHSVTGADYEGQSQAIDVDVTDNDVANLIYSQNPVTVTEGGSGTNYNITLATEPTDQVNVTIDANAQVLVNGGAQVVLAFTAANWNTPQAVNVTAIDDFNIEASPHAGNISYTVASTSDTFYNGLTAPVFNVNVNDNDSAGVIVSPSSVFITEAGASNQFTVTLTSIPTDDVVIPVSVSDATEGNLGGVTDVTLNAGNWNTGVTVTVFPENDNVDDGNIPFTVITGDPTSASDSNYDALNAGNVVDVAVTNIDDDTAGVTITESAGTTNVSEAGATDAYNVVLTSEPTASVTVTVTAVNDVSVDKTSLTFTTGNWNVAQIVTVSAIDDNDVESNPHVGTITHSASGGGYGAVIINSVNANVAENDIAGASTGTASGQATEAGGTLTNTLMLDAKPTVNVTINLSVDDGTEASVSPSSIVFTPFNWNVAQQYTVTGLDDNIIDGNVSYNINFSNMSAPGDANFNNVPVASDGPYTNTDNDVAGVSVVETAGSTEVEEAGAGGTTDTYSIVLDAMPGNSVTINLSHVGGEIEFDAGSGFTTSDTIIIAPGDWDTPVVITVRPTSDGDAEGAHTGTITHTTSSSDGDFHLLTVDSLVVDIIDDDQPGLVITETNGGTEAVEGIPIGSSDSYQIRLQSNPGAVTVTVTLSPQNGELSDFQFQSNGLTTFDFDNTNWNIAQTVEIEANDDGVLDPSDDEVIAHNFTAGSGPYNGLAAVNLNVDIIDTNTPGVTILETAGSTSLDEANAGATDSYNVRLNHPPTGNITVQITDDGQLTPSSSSLIFTPANWYVEQTVTVTVDNDQVDEASPHVSTITHSVSSAPSDADYLPVVIADVNVNISDNDTRGVTITETGSTDVSESLPNTADTYSIVLTSEPTSNVTFTLTGDQVLLNDVNTQGTATSVKTFTFTAGNWSTPQTVYVFPDDDDVDEAATHLGNISHSITGGDYNAFVVSDITVNVTDDDTAAVVLDAGSVTDVDESGTTSTFDLSLATEPTATVSITVYSSDTGEINVSPSVLVFNAGNYATPQTVTITGIDDDIVDGDITVTVGYTAPSSSDAAYAALGGSSTNLDNIDDDTIGFVISETDGNTVVQEEGETSDTFSVALSSEPIGGAGVTVQVSHAASQVDVEGGTSTNLNFTAANWNVPQIVTIEANDDAAAEVNPHTAVLNIDASGDDYNGQSTTLNVDVQDNDQAAITVTPSSGLTVTEAGATTTFDVVLDTAPSATVSVAVVSSDTGEATVDQATLTFTIGDWNTPQTVTVTGVDDNVDDGNITFDIDLTASSTDLIYDGATATAEVTCTDDDTAGMTVTPLLGLTSTENGNVAVFFVYLNTQPTGDVVMDVTSNDTGEGQVSPASLTFTSSNWQSPQIVTVTGQDDNLDDGDVAYAVDVDINIASTVDVNYDAVASKSVQLINIDNDTAGVELFEADGSTDVVEGGATDTYRVRLDTQPTANVTISLSTEKGEVNLSPSSLTFTSGNWNVYQDVTVTAVDDDVEELIAPHSDNIIHSASGGGYDGVSVDDLNVSITDDDSSGLLVSPTSGLSVPEDASSDDTFTIKLQSEPTALVIVNITVDDNSEATVTPSLITFSPSAGVGTDGHWDFNQSITVSGVDDDVVDGSIGFTISVDTVSGDALYNSLNQEVTGQTTDDDTFGITVTPTALTVAETGTSATYSVVLESEPTSDVTINVNTPNSTEISLDTSVLIFNNVNWDAPQFVKVTGVDDPIDDGTQAAVAVNNAASSGDGNYNGIDPADVNVDNDDDDDAAVIIAVSGGLTSVSEAGLTDTYEVSLATQPTTDIDINIAGDGQIVPDVSVLTFTSANWSTPQTVTVSAVNDDIAEGSHSGTITHSSSDAEYNGVSINSVTASIDDDDVVDVVVSPIDGLQTIEDGTQATFTVVLTSEPLVNVVIGVSSDNTAEGTVSPATLTFTPSDWDTPQTVTITGVDELVDDGDQAYNIVLSNASAVGDANYNNFDVSDVSVTNIDDDGAGVTLSKTTLSLSEAGTSDNYTVVLDTQPTDDVTITLSADLSNVNLSQTSLTFTNANYNTPQQITVSADNDDIAEGFHQVTISHTASGDVYTGISISNVAANITDNDTAGVSVSPTSGLTTNEAGASDTFNVVLDSEPTSSVTISVTSQDTSEATVAPGSLTFTPANWDTPQTVTVTGADDALADGNIIYTIALGTAVSDDAFYGGTINPTDVTGTNTDDEVAGITVTPTSGLTTTESGGAAVFTVRLNTEPTDDVVISLASDTASEGTASPATLTFTTSNWDTNQTVTVTGVDDDIDDDDQSYTIVLNTPTSTDTDYNVIDPADVSVSNIDDDDAGFIVTPTSGLVTGESGLTANFTIVLTSEPAADVSVDLNSSNTSEGTVSPATLTFTSGNWDTAQTVTVTGVDDAGVDGDQIYSIVTDPAASADAQYLNLDPDDVSVTNQDDDGAAVNIVQSGGTTLVQEAGASSDTYSLVLATLPTSQVDITLDFGAGAQVSVNPTTVSFTTGNWNVPQIVTVTAVDDSIAEGAHSQVITHTASSIDGNYDYNGGAGLIIGNVTANISDNDTASIIVSPTTGLVTSEAGGTDSFTVVLGTEPTDDVTIPVTSGDLTEGTVSVSSLTFNTGNWDTAQTVTITGVDDASDDGPVAYSITLGLPTSSDGQYAAINPADVSVSNSDNDGVDVIFSESSGSTAVSEDGISDNYSVVLNSQPTDDVIVTPSAGSGLNVSPASLTFTTANWDEAQSFTVTAIDDDIAEGVHYGSISHTTTSAGDSNYNNLSTANVAVDITDNDTAGIIVSPDSGLIVNENGDSDSFTVVLSSEPTANVSITLSSNALSDATVSPSSITFTSGNWDTPRVVTVTGVDDGSTIDGDVAFSIVTGVASSSDGNYNNINPTDVSGVNQDNDQAAVLITINDNLIDEANAGNTASYDVVLTTPPSIGNPVTITISPDADANYAGGNLVFSNGDYNTPQTVTITAVDDSIAEGSHSSVISHSLSSSDGDYNGLSVTSVVLGVADDDTAGITVTPSSGLETNEIGATDTFDVVLLSEPTADVTIVLNSSDTDQANVSTNLLTFTSANWFTAQTVTVTGQDANNADDGDVLFTIVLDDAGSSDPNYDDMSVADVDGTNRNVNNEPTLNTIADQNITEDANTQTVILTGISDGQTGENQTLTLTALSDNTGLIPHPSIVNNMDGTADLTYTPVADQFGSATITVTIQDDGGTAGANDDDTITDQFVITVASDNDLPDIFVDSIMYGGETVAIVAGTGASTTIPNTKLNATDVEDVDTTLVYTLVLQPGQGVVRNGTTTISPGGTWTQADIDAGDINYLHNGLPGGVTDGFAFKVTDSNSGESSDVFQIYVDRQAPSLSLAGTDLVYDENDGAVPFDSGAVLAAGNIDPFDNGFLLVEWAAGQTSNDNIVLTGGITVDINGVVELPGSIVIGSVDTVLDGEDGEDLLINFNTTTPTTANLTTLVRNVSYRNDSDDPDTTLRTIQMTINDGFLSSGVATRNVDMQAQNDDPVIGAATFGTILNVDLNAFLPVSDADGTIVDITIDVAPSLGVVSIIDPATGSFLYQPTPGLSGPDTFDITVEDDLGATTSGTINIQITDVNSTHPRVTSDPPMFAMDGDILVYTPTVDPSTYSGTLTYQLIDKPAGLSDPNSFGTISWDLTGRGGEVLRFSYFITDTGGSNEVGIQPIMIMVVPAPSGGG